MSATEIANRVWNYAHVLRDDGVGYGDYVEQLTFLIFLKMADEREVSGQQVSVPEKYSWAKLVKLDGDALEVQYRHTLEELGKESGMLGTIFRKAQNKIQDPAKLERLMKILNFTVDQLRLTLPIFLKHKCKRLVEGQMAVKYFFLHWNLIGGITILDPN